MIGSPAVWLASLLAVAPELPLTRLTEPSLFQALLAYPPIKSLLPVPILLALAPIVRWFFGSTWVAIDREALGGRGRHEPPPPTMPTEAARRAGDRGRRRAALPSTASRPSRIVQLRRRAVAAPPARRPGAQSAPPGFDYRPVVVLVVTAVVLTWQEYYGGRRFYSDTLKPWLLALEADGRPWLAMARFDELYSFAWWTLARFIGYVAIPFPLYKLLFPRDSLLDLGLRVRGLASHAWIYALCLAVVLPATALVASQPDFGTYYPFYKLSSRSWFDFAAWEAMYWFQFLTLEMFFRGFMLGALRRSLGSAAIFAMAVPYCMIHYGKPYLEANGAIVAGVVLGSLAMHTRSIYAGFLVHVTVAALMDFLALWKLDGLPTALVPW